MKEIEQVDALISALTHYRDYYSPVDIDAEENLRALLTETISTLTDLQTDRDNWRSRAAERDTECERRFQAQYEAVERAEAAEVKVVRLRSALEPYADPTTYQRARSVLSDD